MPSLLSRFLGKKRNADPTSLLDGEKYEAVPKTTSPTAPASADSTQPPKPKQKEQPDKGQNMHGRRKHSSPSGPGLREPKLSQSVPLLSLSLPESKGEEKKSQGLGVVFEGITDGSPRLDDEALGDKRLTPSETLALVQKTSEVISERGLDTLGVMRPHWFASPRQQEIQLKLVHRFLQTLSPQQINGVPSTSSSSSPAAFESELRYSRDPHDVAAVLRWGLRHLQLEGDSFGSSNTEEWYRTFADSERSGSYPTKAFDDILVPLLPASHTQLLRVTLDLVSSLAAHSEENGISGNKLSKVLGWWIVSSRNVQGTEWQEFYTQWDAAARQFEHIFLAYIRAQEAQSRIPKRLTELVKGYPFAKSRQEDGIFLPRPRLSTRSANALFVKVTVDKAGVSSRPHPLRVVEDAFRAKAESQSTGEFVALWEEIRKIASTSGEGGQEEKEETKDAAPPLNLSTILADESIRLLSLVPVPDSAAAPTVSLFTPLPTGRGRRSLSVGDRSPTTTTINGRIEGSSKDATAHSKAATSPPTSYQDRDIAPDWQLFSSSGFDSPSGLSLAASLWDNETEVSQPVSKKSGAGKRSLSLRPNSRRGSTESPRPSQTPPVAKPDRLTYGVPCLVKLDEAFIDFWADSLLDSVARTWPTFVVCQLKSIPTLRIKEDDKPIEWLVIECVSTEPVRPTPRATPPAVKTSAASARAASPVQSSPTKSEGGKSAKWAASTLSATRKRWSFFSPRHDSAPAIQGGKDRATKKAAKDAKVGEMGEILREEDEGKPNGMHANGPKNAEAPKKQADKAQGAVATPTAIHANGVSKEPTATKPEEAAGPEAAEAPVQGLAAVVEEPSDESQPAAEPVTLQKDVQPPQAPAAEAISESQPVVEQLAHPEPTQATEKSQAPRAFAPAPVDTDAPPAAEAVQEESVLPVHAQSEDTDIPNATPAPVEEAQVSSRQEQAEEVPSQLLQANPVDLSQSSNEHPSSESQPSAIPDTAVETQHHDQPDVQEAAVEHAPSKLAAEQTREEPVAVSHQANEVTPVVPEPQVEATPEPERHTLQEPIDEPIAAPTSSHADEEPDPAPVQTTHAEQPESEESHHVEPTPVAHEENAAPSPSKSEPDAEEPAVVESEPPIGVEDAQNEDAVPPEIPTENHSEKSHTEAAV